MTMNHEHPSGGASFWKSKSGIALCAFLGITAVFPILEHRAHALQWLPYALLLACPLLHFFMHGSHGGHGAQQKPRADDPPAPRGEERR